MIYGFSLLMFMLGLVLVIPAGRRLLYMRDVRKDSGSTSGQVASTKSATGWLWTASFGNQDRPLVKYITPRGTELVLEIVSSSFLPQKNYETGELVKVIYDRESPGRAYVEREWGSALRDLWTGVAALVLSVVLWAVGQALGLPF